MPEPVPLAEEVEALFALVRARYGSRLDPDQLEAVHRQVREVVARARALRAVPLAGSDEPVPTWTPYRADD